MLDINLDSVGLTAIGLIFVVSFLKVMHWRAVRQSLSENGHTRAGRRESDWHRSFWDDDQSTDPIGVYKTEPSHSIRGAG